MSTKEENKPLTLQESDDVVDGLVITTITRHHMSVNIEGLLRQFKRKKIRFFQDENGRTISDTEARKYIAECQAKGWKYLPSTNCEGFDPFEKGCPGHKIDDNEKQ